MFHLILNVEVCFFQESRLLPLSALQTVPISTALRFLVQKVYFVWKRVCLTSPPPRPRLSANRKLLALGLTLLEKGLLTYSITKTTLNKRVTAKSRASV